ncbi:MAG: recombinase family protein [Oscillatoriales cyanobacterium]|nr:MAG: recombinase family protein [Oscillatoriales cyanobacterium]
MLALVGNGETRGALMQQLAAARWPAIDCTTPLGFFEQEVILFYPRLAQRTGVLPIVPWPQFPVILRPENEQELAGRCWAEGDPDALGAIAAPAWERLVRRLLDLMQLAANGSVAVAEIPDRLLQGLGPAAAVELPGGWVERAGEAIEQWRSWCLARGLLTYGLVSWLYGEFLLSDPAYGDRLRQRYALVLADDTDDFPALAGRLLTKLLEGGATGYFTHNPDGGARSGLGADPAALQTLADRCELVDLGRANQPLVQHIAPVLVAVAHDPFAIAQWADQWPAEVQTIATLSRSQLLRETAETIVQAVQSGQVAPQDIAVIGPGLDAIAGYSLSTILRDRGLPIDWSGNRRPPISSPLVRSLLALWALVYPGLGDWLNREDVAEMLVCLSLEPDPLRSPTDPDRAVSDPQAPPPGLQRAIDPVRAGLIADHCFQPDRQAPKLLPIAAFVRWDRLGYRAATAYERLLDWIDQQQTQVRQRLVTSPLLVLDRAVQQFLWHGGQLDPAELAILRELLEAAQRYWEVGNRIDPQAPPTETIARFISLLRRGTFTADPFPLRAFAPEAEGVTLANIFQYRTRRLAHRWHFWLDVGSPLWPRGGAAVLFGSSLFLQNWAGRRWTVDDEEAADRDRLERLLYDLLGRCRDRLYLCHSELSVAGQDQAGPLRAIVDAAPIAITRTEP